jgi:hypothetical protein
LHGMWVDPTLSHLSFILVGPILTLYARMGPLQKTIGEGVVCASDVPNRLSARFKHITCAYHPLLKKKYLEPPHRGDLYGAGHDSSLLRFMIMNPAAAIQNPAGSRTRQDQAKTDPGRAAGPRWALTRPSALSFRPDATSCGAQRALGYWCWHCVLRSMLRCVM